VIAVEGNTCTAAMRGDAAPPWSQTPITHEESASEPGRSRVWPDGANRTVRVGKVRSRSQ
jgi:hypothetical protein